MSLNGSKFLDFDGLKYFFDKIKSIIDTKSDKILKEESEESVKIIQIKPNVFYNFGEVTNLNITFLPEIPNIYNEYMFQFISGNEPTILSLPLSLKWITGAPPIIESKMVYQVSIVNNLALYESWPYE